MRRSRQTLGLCAGLYVRHCRSRVMNRCASSSADVTSELKSRSPTTRVMNIVRERKIPVEKFSLSRGLALNRFEKDFLIYPEYTDVDSLASIKSFVGVFQKDFESSLADATSETFGEKLTDLLKRHQLPAAYVSKDFGGLGMCNKDLLTISEVLGLNWNAFEAVNQVHIASVLVTLFGDDAQKTRLLPLIASGALRPAVCLVEEDVGFDFEAMKTEVVSGGESSFKLYGSKSRVIGASTANLFFVFANQKSSKEGTQGFGCYIVERDSVPEGAIKVTSRAKTLGLNNLEISSVEFRDVTLDESNRLGSFSEGRDVALEVASAHNITYAAAVTGFMRSLLGKLAKFCNTNARHNLRLADSRGIQRLMTELALSTYVLESMAYYIGGLLDENLIITVDIENAIIHKYANRVLREAVATVTEIVGLSACDCNFEYEKMIRDVSTLMSLGNMEMNLIDQISVGTITSWANANAIDLEKLRSGAAGFFGRVFGTASKWHYEEDPKLQHYIAEHAHQSLEPACRELEQMMSRLNGVLGAIISEQGKTAVTDFAMLCSVSKVVENNLAMMASISRASRAYSIGLRNADLEMTWAVTFCARASVESQSELNLLGRYFGLVRLNPSLLHIGRAVLDSNGYCVESPTELNW